MHTNIFRHIGYESLSNLPFERGFDECLFFTAGTQQYYTKTICSDWEYFDDEAPELSQDIIDQRNELYGPDRVCAYDIWDSSYTPYKDNIDIYSERIYTDKVIDFVSKWHDNSESNPFFIYYAMPTPHNPLVTPPITNYTECEHIADNNRKLQCQMVQYADGLIGEIVHVLQTKNIYDDTIIIFASDNGPATGGPRGQSLPLRGRKSSKYEGGIRTAAFISGGFVESMELDCDRYDGLFHVTDWYLTILQMAGFDGNEIEELDGFGLWDVIINECDDRWNDTAAWSEDGDMDLVENEEFLQRNMIISARMCDDDSYFINTYMRYNQWKLIVNGTYRECGGGEGNERNNYYINYDATFTYTPNENVYEEYVDNTEYAEYFRSECYDDMNDEERNDTLNFLYDELMLFNIEQDAIEACDVKEDNMEIVDNLLELLYENVAGNYYGSVSGNPVASSVLAQFESYSCEYDETYLISWSDQECCNDDTFDDWEYVWTRAIEIKQECPDGNI